MDFINQLCDDAEEITLTRRNIARLIVLARKGDYHAAQRLTEIFSIAVRKRAPVPPMLLRYFALCFSRIRRQEELGGGKGSVDVAACLNMGRSTGRPSDPAKNLRDEIMASEVIEQMKKGKTRELALNDVSLEFCVSWSTVKLAYETHAARLRSIAA